MNSTIGKSMRVQQLGTDASLRQNRPSAGVAEEDPVRRYVISETIEGARGAPDLPESLYITQL